MVVMVALTTVRMVVHQRQRVDACFTRKLTLFHARQDASRLQLIAEWHFHFPASDSPHPTSGASPLGTTRHFAELI
jgi:hypothetical protein